mmetsp:Transcript_2832/g.8648  ORF Transcript_2832/g.8648 Transcript_2832/m.8648 type:complete len:508 (-) Transcript_2832:1696-3219(-)|eukprot:CAMPEP_0198729862 /NCGR_PEP_ID=MMETSP1475-20131203/21365_1 /TAXON_ID= ORGANISM="Unidentified sp., Strain CCMP1999" /NCGR_SAMPLE_ID=MMETSP1475 /ASSEMBLY_ACC=CAM_ASM_001111 /LENGTH=507 /DNA_ID=CAMNT_0044492577 /DNA_START=64 /DNA_END=1587 /DNA_ORIENTATION=-
MSKRSKGKPALGQSLVTHGGALRPGATSGRKERRERARTRHSTLDGHDGGVGGGGSKGFTSVLEVSDLAEIMLDAELSDRSFAASRGPVLLNKSATNTKVEKVRRLSEADRDVLRLPRRPQWNTNMSAAHLEKLEREAFLHWRRGLAAVEESSHKIMTPFEKNLDIWRQLWRVVEKSDVLIQIVDGRDPLLFYCEDLVRYVAELSTEERPKQCLVLMNKADLVPGALLPEWQEYFRAQDMPVLFFSAVESAAPRQDDVGAEEESAPAVEALEFPSGTDIVQQEREDYAKLCVSESEESGEDVKICTTEELLEEFHNMMPAWKAARRSELGAEERKVHPADSRVVIGMVGYPNVGKSSTINAIIGSKKVSVSSTPGKTKHFQTLLLDDEVMLCDCPGLVFPNFASSQAELVTRGVLPIDQLHDPGPAIEVICSVVPRETLEDLYGIKIPHELDSPAELANNLLESHARARGFRTKHDLADHQRSARIILKDYVNGKLNFCAEPPGTAG